MRSNKNMTYKYVQTNNIQLHVAFAGPEDGKPVFFLHGFPDASFGWDYQITALANQNFFVIAPDQRGYNLSDKPKGVRNYHMNLLVEDIISLANALEIDQFYLAGHDFGAMVSWHLIEKYSNRVKRLVILNVPHPRVMRYFLQNNKKQRRKSSYAFFFKIPIIPELVIKLSRWRVLMRAMKDSFSSEKLQRYKTAWSQKGSLTAMLNWYRSFFNLKPEEQPQRMIEVPTLIIWGKQDPHIMWEMAAESAKMCINVKVEYIEEATHWVLEDAPEITSQLIIDHFKQYNK